MLMMAEETWLKKQKSDVSGVNVQWVGVVDVMAWMKPQMVEMLWTWRV